MVGTSASRWPASRASLQRACQAAGSVKSSGSGTGDGVYTAGYTGAPITPGSSSGGSSATGTSRTAEEWKLCSSAGKARAFT